jgi:hypothetical protein
MFHTTRVSSTVIQCMTLEHNVRYVMYSTIYPSNSWMIFIFAIYYICLKLWKYYSEVWKFHSVPFAMNITKNDEQTALVMQIRIGTHRTLFMQDLGSHSSSEDQSSGMLCPIPQWTGINIFKVQPWDGSEVGKEIFSAIFVKPFALLGKICCKCHNSNFQHSYVI